MRHVLVLYGCTYGMMPALRHQVRKGNITEIHLEEAGRRLD